ncbi:phage virion morphogenesis protein [Sphingomonas koreensis]|uniref:phage virion morphogenesis protein n=1 Tax=Sphingomonas koreensis TaxID=93064 RepID=UPI000F7E97F6|nr:phage virion morphogenesis protein [Sphingomonas koreensis]MDC7808787.1 phage virion morphogenesis protein [Sphingomonas koreensis]RSU98927.1 phage virion morphogenesis protein [Sphingomonas koreensis]
MTNNGFEALELELGRLLANVAPDRRAGLAVRMGRALRRAQARRIAEQKNPDGSAFAPRKPRELGRGRRGTIRRRAQGGPMFRKLRLSQWLRDNAGVDEVVVGFAGAAGRIARVHQLGLRDRVSRDPGAAEVTYPQRVLVGFRQQDIDMLLGMAAAAIAE